MENNYWILLQKMVLDVLKTASKTVDHKTAEATGQFIGNKIADKIVKSKPVSDVNLTDVEENAIPPEKREETLNKLR